MRICFKKIITTGSALMLLAVLMLTGCGNKQFDAADYVGAMLDASYKGDYGAYTKQDIGKKKDARTMHEDNLNALVDAFSDVFGTDMDEESKKQLSESMGTLCEHVQYEVGEATADGSHFNVELKVKPLQFSSVLQDDEFNKAAEEAVKKAIEADQDISSEELMKVLSKLLIDRFDEIAKNPTYADETTMTVVVEKNDQGEYEISKDSWDLIDRALIQ
ncbi:MAG: hypothetical protein IJJ07_01635 [Lachnospiraceae bacterium]|nr:hypothetical protein [Lachnospiraceae bacterium]MBQ6353641.1 hypothetical protein [Lachnospiraceae bacterium]MBR2753133.1 hypothetical protein [Lachnospiraceae bacterium]